MNTLSSRILLAGLLVVGLSAKLQPRQSFLTAQKSTPQSSKTSVPSFSGSWVARYRSIGENGQVQMYINPAGNLFGSFASDDGFQFAQISGNHRGNTFHIVLTPPSGVSQLATSKVVDATARWENGLSGRFIISGEAVGHPYSYTFKRLKQN